MLLGTCKVSGTGQAYNWRSLWGQILPSQCPSPLVPPATWWVPCIRHFKQLLPVFRVLCPYPSSPHWPAHCPRPTACGPLPTAHSPRSTAHDPQSTAHCSGLLRLSSANSSSFSPPEPSLRASCWGPHNPCHGSPSSGCHMTEIILDAFPY